MTRLIILMVLVAVTTNGLFADDANTKEIGAIWQKSYTTATPNACPFNSLNTTDLFCDKLKQVLVNKGKWSVNTGVWEGDTATANDIDSAGSDKADWVDLFVWTGHGPSDARYWPDGGNLHFVTNHSLNTAQDYCDATADAGNISHDECSWGQGDCEVVIAFTCSYLADRGDPAILRRIKKMCQGAHIICGFSSLMIVNRDQGTTLGKYLMGQAGWFVVDITPKTVIQAWNKSCDEHQPSGTIASVVYHDSCEGDYMPGNLKWANGAAWQMSADPPACTDANINDYIKDNHVVP